MWFRSLFDAFLARSSRRPARQKHLAPKSRRRPGSFRPRLDILEDRSLPSTFTVTNLLDTGPDSLRAAITAANVNPGADTIDFAVTGTIGLTSGELDITDSLTIIGPGASALTVSGSHVSRVFGLYGNPTVSIADLTVANGWTSGSPGGGITMAGGNLTLDRVAVSGNGAGGDGVGGDGLGGGLYVAGGTLTLDHSTLSGNGASGSGGFTYPVGNYSPAGSAAGGGLYVAGGMVYVNQSTLSGNQAVGGNGNPADACAGVYAGGGGDGLGGGLYVAGGAVSIDNSTFSANGARGGDGGAGDYCADAPPGNQYVPGGPGGWGAGGGIRVAAGIVYVKQSTLSGNGATGGLGGPVGLGDYPGAPGVGVGGGLYIAPAAPPIVDMDTYTESNTINNVAGIDPNISGPYSLNGTYTQPSTFTVSGFPAITTAGIAGSFTVTAKNADGTIDTGYTGTVYFSSSDGLAGLPAAYAFTAADNGVHTFSATLKTAGTQSLTATDTTTASVTGAASGITVSPAATSHFGVSAPVGSVAGSAFSITLTARDLYGNTTTGYTGTVHFGSTDGQANLPADYSFTAADAGVHAFINGMTLKTAGGQSITATDTVTNSITGNSAVTVSSAVASTMSVAGFPSSATAGVAGNFTVMLKDAYSNVATGYTGTVRFTSSDTKASLPANYTFTAADAGVHTFSATLKTAGTQSIKVTDTTSVSLTSTDGGITVNAAVASKFIISAPSSVTAGVAFGLTLTVEDAYGNVVKGYIGTVHFSSTDNRATLPANYTFTAADNGVHTFTGLVLRKRGTQKITITDTLNSSLTGSVTENVL